MSKRRLTISLDEEILKELDRQAKNAGLTKSAFLTTLITKNRKEA